MDVATITVNTVAGLTILAVFLHAIWTIIRHRKGRKASARDSSSSNATGWADAGGSQEVGDGGGDGGGGGD
jgi:hypothetical protein